MQFWKTASLFTYAQGYMQELIADLERQKRVLMNAAMIEARDREAVAQLSVGSSHQSLPLPRSPATEAPVQSTREDSQSAPDPSPVIASSPSPKEATQQPDPWSQARPDETQSWSPRVIRRGT